MATITTVQTSSRRCSYCRKNGHNIRSCEKRILQEKELMKSLRKKENENKVNESSRIKELTYEIIVKNTRYLILSDIGLCLLIIII